MRLNHWCGDLRPPVIQSHNTEKGKERLLDGSEKQGKLLSVEIDAQNGIHIVYEHKKKRRPSDAGKRIDNSDDYHPQMSCTGYHTENPQRSEYPYCREHPELRQK